MTERILTFTTKEGELKSYPEGLYFHMPFAEYLDLQCLSSSMIKNLLISPTDGWAGSWLNPLREDLQSERKHYEEGKAYHVRILEGKDAFYKQYASDFEDDQDPAMIRGGKEITAALKACGAKSSFDTVYDGALRLKDADPKVRILAIEERAHQDKFPGRKFLPASLVRYIEYAARLIECDPKINHYFIGGHPEVSVLWFDEDYQVWFKARYDYLKVGPAGDLKTFANIMEQNLDRAIKNTMAARRYFIQAALYLNGNDVGKRLAQEGKVFGYTGEARWLEAYSKTPCDRFNWVFQKKGIAPVARGGYITKGSEIHKNGIGKVAEAVETYRRNLEAFGQDMWITSEEPIHFDNSELPSYSENL